jgi:hypothetical protein
MEAGTRKTTLGSVENMLAARSLDVGLEPGHCVRIAVALHNKKRTIVL